MYQKFFKRLIDILCALAALLVFGWLYIIVAILVRVNLGSPVIFKQARPGKDCKIFNLYKFRTMTDERDENGNLLPDDVRLTKFGKFLRATSLDELPEAINILKGDMSVVGPRPLLCHYVSLYNEEQLRRQSVRPGLTGYAQVNGRNSLSWEEKFAMDVEYVDNISFIWDVKLIFQTVWKCIKRDGISSQNCATTEEFTGNKLEMLVDE